MDKLAIILMVYALLPMTAFSQDDLYFLPSDEPDEPVFVEYSEPEVVYYSGSDRDVDEYNRYGTYVEEIDSVGNDIIEFDGEIGVYPDSVSGGDYECTRQMSRFDDYEWDEAYREGYYDGLYNSWRYYDPWYYWSWYYDPWYYWGWYYSPWYYGRYSHYHHYWPVAFYHRPYRGSVTGTRNHGIVNRNTYRGRGFSGYRGTTTAGTNSSTTTSRSFSGNRSSSRVNVNTSTSRSSYSSGNFGSSRSSGSFGGGRSGGSGGSRSGGGFGGRR